MRITRTSIIILYFSIVCIQCKSQKESLNDKIALKNGQIISMSSKEIISGKTILISKGKIIDIVPSNRIPSGYQVISMEGKYIMPGLIDMHIHLRALDEFTSYLNYGVTTVMHMSGPTSQAPDLEKYRDQINLGYLEAPRLFFASHNVEGKEINYPGVSISITNQTQVIDFIKTVKKRKCDFVKVYETIDSVNYKILINEASKAGVTVVGHMPRNISPTTVLTSGQKMIAHSEEFFFDFFDCRNCGKDKRPDTTKIPLLISLLKSKNILVTPNLSFVNATHGALTNIDSIWKEDEVKFLPPNIYQTWQNSDPNRRSNLNDFKDREAVKYPFLQKLVKTLYDSGIVLLAGSDASLIGLPPGKSLIQDIFELNKTGIDPYGCLAAATTNAGKFISTYSVTGTGLKIGEVKKNYVADLLILNSNPLENLNNLYSIEAVIANGKFLSKEYLKRKRKKYR